MQTHHDTPSTRRRRARRPVDPLSRAARRDTTSARERVMADYTRELRADARAESLATFWDRRFA